MDLDDDNAFDQCNNKFPRLTTNNHASSIHNNGITSLTSRQTTRMDEDREKSDNKRLTTNNTVVGNIDLGRFYNNWPSSRIVRVSRASGGKDRHSKVLTSKGLRDRRVRLSVNTAIEFYDLQDRLGYDQPSKAVEWLLKAASSSISELPPIPNPFPNTPPKLCDEKRLSSDQLVLEDVDPVVNHEVGGGDNCCNNNNSYLHNHHEQQVVGNKSCSSVSTTETSKGSSGLSLSRSEIRVKARERAKERVAEKEKEKEDDVDTCHHLGSSSLNPISQTMTSSFTELLSSGMNSHNTPNSSPNNSGGGGNGSSINHHESNFFLKSPRLWSATTTTTSSTTPLDYFTTSGLQMQLASNPQMAYSPLFSHVINGEHHNNNNNGELQHFSFVPDHHHHHHHMVHAMNNDNHGSNNNDSNDQDQQHHGTLNFTIASSSSNASLLAGFNRGTLQSNTSSSSSSSLSMLLPHQYHLQRFSNLEGSPHHQSFFIAPMDSNNNSNNNNHYQFNLSGYDAAAARLQLYHGDPNHHLAGNNNNNNGNSGRHPKGKGKN